jgi:hypothetical protein
MVARNEKYYHNDAMTRRPPRSSAAPVVNKSAESAESVDAFESLSRSGETRFLFVDHCSLPTGVGMTLDPVTGLYYSRNRNYDPSLGRWVNQDPAGYPGAEAQPRPSASAGFRGIEEAYTAGECRWLPLNINGANTYQFVESNPVGKVDPSGMVSLPPGIVGSPPPSPPPSGSLWPAYPPTGGLSGTWWYPVPLPGGPIRITGGVNGNLGNYGNLSVGLQAGAICNLGNNWSLTTQLSGSGSLSGGQPGWGISWGLVHTQSGLFPW